MQEQYLKSGELARLSGVSTDTVRHYERLKLLVAPRRSAGNYRLYPPETVDRVRLIRRAVAVGFSLSELARILKIRDAGGAPCQQARRLLEEKLSKVEQQLQNLKALRAHLKILLRDWKTRLNQTAAGKQARLLEILVKDERYEKIPRARIAGGRNGRL